MAGEIGWYDVTSQLQSNADGMDDVSNARNKMSFVKVCTTPTEGGAAILIQQLQAAGFHPCPLSVAPHISLVGVDRGFSIEVPMGEASQAREYLRSLGAERDLCE